MWWAQFGPTDLNRVNVTESLDKYLTYGSAPAVQCPCQNFGVMGANHNRLAQNYRCQLAYFSKLRALTYYEFYNNIESLNFLLPFFW